MNTELAQSVGDRTIGLVISSFENNLKLWDPLVQNRVLTKNVDCHANEISPVDCLVLDQVLTQKVFEKLGMRQRLAEPHALIVTHTTPTKCVDTTVPFNFVYFQRETAEAKQMEWRAYVSDVPFEKFKAALLSTPIGSFLRVDKLDGTMKIVSMDKNEVGHPTVVLSELNVGHPGDSATPSKANPVGAKANTKEDTDAEVRRVVKELAKEAANIPEITVCKDLPKDRPPILDASPDQTIAATSPGCVAVWCNLHFKDKASVSASLELVTEAFKKDVVRDTFQHAQYESKDNKVQICFHVFEARQDLFTILALGVVRKMKQLGKLVNGGIWV